MAKIVLGLGSSHTPMLLASDETLPRFRRDRPEDQAPRQGRAARDLCRASGKGRSEDGGDGRARRARRAAEQGARREGALEQDAEQRQARYAHRDERRPGRSLSGRRPSNLCDLLRRHHPQQQRAARAIPSALSRMVREEPARLLRGKQAARLSGRCQACPASDRLADGATASIRRRRNACARAKAKATAWPMCTAA